MAGGLLTACLPPFFIIDFLGMDNRYYKQAGPDTPLYLSNGQRLVFPSVDGKYGFIATNDKFLIGEINTAINTFKGGVSVCTKDEYKDYLKKKILGSSAREEVEGGDQGRVRDRLVNASPVPRGCSACVQPRVW